MDFFALRVPEIAAAASEAAPTSLAIPPRTPNLRLPPSPASSRRTPPSPSHASACPLPPPSPSASPVSSPHAAMAGSFARGGGSGTGQQEKLLRSMSSQWYSSRSLRDGRNISVSSPSRMLSTNLNLKAAAVTCFADDSPCIGADSAGDAPSNEAIGLKSPGNGTPAAAASSAPSATRSATAAGIPRRGVLKRMTSLPSMSAAYHAKSSLPATSPLFIPTSAIPPATVTTAEAIADATAAAPSTTGPPSPAFSPNGSPKGTSQLSPGLSPKAQHVRRVSFCSMVRVRRFSACDADLGSAADDALTAVAKAEAAAAGERETAAAAAAATQVAAVNAAKASQEAREGKEAEEKARAASDSSAARHPIQRGIRSFIERPHRRHSHSPSYFGPLHLIPELAAPSRAIRRSSSFQHLEAAAAHVG
ncbi:unnamed protein product [Closterium sp. Naga37s-1]|nr:unnamed protein product [Closterium sp. Naga37s-1]